MREMKDSGVDWIGEIPHDWEIVQTKRVFRSIKRVVGNQVGEYDRLALTLNGVIKRSKEDNEGLQPEKFEGYQILKENELVFKLIDLENVKTSRVGLSSYTGLVSPAYIVLTNESKDNRFYYYWFMFMYYNEVFNHLGGDGVRSALNAKDLTAIPVPFINECKQHRIADYLDEKCSKIDAIIKKQQTVIEKLKAYKLSNINELIVEVEGQSIHLGYIANMKNGLNFNVAPNGKPLKFLGVGDFKDYFVLDREDMFSDILIDEEIDEDYMLKDGDIVFVRSNGSKDLVGRTVMVENIDFPLSYSGFCIRFRNIRTDILNDRYLLYFFRSPYFREQLKKYSQGSNINNINQVLLSQISITVPSIEIQKRAIDDVERLSYNLDKTILGKQTLIDMLIAYKKSLIYEVVTGKKEI
ncbi:restriction endonuclease subunit S [Streptococcus parasanguinis]|uniref:restriction endonuclease subunit S n=1 Tax=Streptococcus parasanguinis TaxID=1318 RepID=UPI0025549500|nr:restriction endonuclease subunit S [Streptococcus parasanguinis]MDK8142717.1 restriction endonuclease subunit S [Streptococcus parasanguinis]